MSSQTRKKAAELAVGLFFITACLALLFLALQVSGVKYSFHSDHYSVMADFDDIGGLKVRAPVRIAGVRIGSVHSIQLNHETYRARVVLWLDQAQLGIPIDSSAHIFTEGVLGTKYIGINPGFSDQTLKAGGKIQETHGSMILENMIGQFLFNSGASKSKSEQTENDQTEKQ